MTANFFAIRWTEGDGKNYVDLLPKDGLLNAKCAVLTHSVMGPKKGQYEARCRVEVRKAEVLLDYSEFAEFNSLRDMECGQLRLHFSDATLKALERADWRDRGKKTFSSHGIEIIFHAKLPKFPPYKARSNTSKKAVREIKLRPDQVKFRNILKLVYSNKCCISDCQVDEVLEAAHIDPFSGKNSDNPQNGLLMRRDLHALFDANLLGVEPRSLGVHFTESVCDWGEYKKLNGKAHLNQPLDPSYRPSRDALETRWSIFKSQSKLSAKGRRRG